MEKELVHSSGMEKIVFLSALDEPRNKSKISKIWDVTVSGGPLYKKSTNRGIDHYIEEGLLEKEGNDFSANLKSEAFKEDLEKVLDQSGDVNEYFKEDIDNFVDFLTQEEIINTLLTPQTIKKVLGSEKEQRLENVREERLSKYFEILVNASIKLWMDKRSESFFDGFDAGDMMHGMVKGMFSALFDDIRKDSPYNVEYLSNKLEDLYERDEESVSYFLDKYDKMVSEELSNAMPHNP